MRKSTLMPPKKMELPMKFINFFIGTVVSMQNVGASTKDYAAHLVCSTVSSKEKSAQYKIIQSSGDPSEVEAFCSSVAGTIAKVKARYESSQNAELVSLTFGAEGKDTRGYRVDHWIQLTEDLGRKKSIQLQSNYGGEKVSNKCECEIVVVDTTHPRLDPVCEQLAEQSAIKCVGNGSSIESSQLTERLIFGNDIRDRFQFSVRKDGVVKKVIVKVGRNFYYRNCREIETYIANQICKH